MQEGANEYHYTIVDPRPYDEHVWILYKLGLYISRPHWLLLRSRIRCLESYTSVKDELDHN